MSVYNKYKKGSLWRKWDLQVATKHYINYTGISLSAEHVDTLKLLTGLSAQQINSDHQSLSGEDYAKLFVEFLANLTDIKAIAIMNHNTGLGIQEIIEYLNSKKDYTDNTGIKSHSSAIFKISVTPKSLEFAGAPFVNL